MDSGLDQSQYNRVYDLVQLNLVSLSVKADKLRNNMAPNRTEVTVSATKPAIQLPKVVIPQFSGDYLKWRQFNDLFTEMVDKQPIPAIQKMWYLKTNLSGEAEHLISQFSLSEENYQAAWKTVQERYNNKRVLVANLVEKLLNQPAATSSAASIKDLHDSTKECLLALNNLGIGTSSWDAILIQLLFRKIEKNVHLRFMQSLQNPKEVPKVADVLSFLELQFQSMEAIAQKEKPMQKAVSSVITSNKSNSTCKFCSNDIHKIYYCNKFLQLSEAERLNWVQQQKMCVNCFKTDHAAKTCTSGCCKKCEKKHNTLLHLGKQSQKPRRPAIQNQDSSTSKANSSSSSNAVAVTSAATNATTGRQGYVLLATAKVIITAPNGASDEFRAILDSGSQVNLVTERLIKRLAIASTEASLCIDGVGKVQKRSTHRVNISMKSRDLSFTTDLEAFILPSIVPAQPNQHIDVSSWGLPKHIHLADPQFNKQEKIDILLGAEFYFSLTQPGTIKLSDDLPTFQNTSLGWIVGGSILRNPLPNSSNALTCSILPKTSLEEAIEQLWKMDEVEPSNKRLSPDERHCESHFNQHVHTNGDGRFIVSLPFRESPTALGESHAMAYNRFMSLERRLQKDDVIRTQYTKFMQEYEQLGHMERINLDTVLDPKYFIPHHCVLKPDSSSTKLRVVFDASAKTSSGHSLNDLMFTGPTVQSDLLSILLRFRLPRFVFTTDIEKMYRQILIHPDNQQCQIIIWRENPSSPIHYYKLNTVTYGTRAAPYLATRCLMKIAEENAVTYPFGSQMLKDNFYVDDGLGGSDSLNIATEIQKELITILKSHGFNLKKWCANHPQLLKNIPLGDQEVNMDFNDNYANTIKTLGLMWLPKTDQFCVKVKLNQLTIVSKRTATSDLARLFDPLGLLAPVVVKAKIFIQQLWQVKLDWDEPLPKDLHAIWTSFRSDLESINNFKITRHIFKGELPVTTQLHVFADASEKAFGAVAYIRAILRDGRVIVHLLCAKTRVAPLKQQTLPRLELCAAVTAAELADRIKTDLQMKNQPVFLWTDSEIVLSWINAQSSLYHTFVANRVATIQSLTLPEQWRHVGSKDNPADILSRGLSAAKLPRCNLWFYGPLFLHGREQLWPPKFSQQCQIHTDMEKKKIIPISAVTVASEDFIYKIPHKNSFKTLQRILGYVLRFIKNSRIQKTQRPECKSLTPGELDNALFIIITTIQKSEFSSEIKQLQKNRQIDNNSSIISLFPFLDENKILRVGGRLDASTLSYDAKHQMLIPYNDPLIKLLFTMFHEENNHCGPLALLNIVRQRYWPIKGKIMARATVQKCIRCNKARPKICQQIMGNLPQARITPARPFVNSGVDYFGPLWIHYKIRGKRPTKAYVAVFCCFASKAVHLELVSDLTTEAFIGALKRFISRRGRCQNIYSDNATNFVGANNKLAELSDSIFSESGKESITSTFSSKGIEFHFIPPRSPHFGGLWEAAVKSAKHLLIRSVGTASLTYEELETVIVEIEAILNSRPLTPMTNDPSDMSALTPGHLLIGEALTQQVDSAASSRKLSSLSRWELVSQLKHEFWRRWSTEYLNELQQRQKWNKQQPNLKIGDMVIIKEDNLPVMKWPLGRIMQIHTGDDGFVRVVEVKTVNGLFKRPIHRLALLPIDNDLEEPVQDNNDIPESSDEPKAKKKRMILTAPSLTTALFVIIFLMPLAWASEVVNTKFASDVGIHFEGIGQVKTSRTNWQLVVYYELDPYWKEIQAFSNGTLALRQLCQEMKQSSSCRNLITVLNHVEDELILANSILPTTRNKRGALNIVGNIANSLFGVLDSDYAKQMTNTIELVKGNDAHLLNLLKNQTSILDATINIIKQDEASIKKKLDQLDAQSTEILTRINRVAEEEYQSQIFQTFISLSLQLTIAAANLQRIKSSILDVLTDTHHGKISPNLLSAKQLEVELIKIRNYLPSSLQIPVDHDNQLQLYKLMTVEGGLTKDHVIFKITIPLCDQEVFELYKLYPVPNILNNSLIAIKLCDEMLAMSPHRDQYFPMNSATLNACTLTKEDTYLCSNVQSKYNKGSEICSCEIELLNNNTHSVCNLERLRTNATWTQLSNNNKWMYAFNAPRRLNTVCDRHGQQLTLVGSGILTLQPQCVIKDESITIQGHQSVTSNSYDSYTSLINLENVSRPNPVDPLTHTMDTYRIHLENLTDLQNLLAQQTALDLPTQIENINLHYTIVGYTALTLAIILIVYNIWSRYTTKKYNPREAPSDHPIPQQRTTTPKFNVIET